MEEHLERQLIENCAPTLASLKTGSLFNLRLDGELAGISPEVAQGRLAEDIDKWNEKFYDMGIRLCLLRVSQTSALVYVYRLSSMYNTLSRPEVIEFLDNYGYDNSAHTDSYIEHLRCRIADISSDGELGFPHEIGVFLGYPLDDVKGFIENKGRKSKYTGMWKVYGDEAHARKCFDKFEKCKSVYSNLWRSGRRSVMQLTVAG